MVLHLNWAQWVYVNVINRINLLSMSKSSQMNKQMFWGLFPQTSEMCCSWKIDTQYFLTNECWGGSWKIEDLSQTNSCQNTTSLVVNTCVSVCVCVIKCVTTVYDYFCLFCVPVCTQDSWFLHHHLHWQLHQHRSRAELKHRWETSCLSGLGEGRSQKSLTNLLFFFLSIR